MCEWLMKLSSFFSIAGQRQNTVVYPSRSPDTMKRKFLSVVFPTSLSLFLFSLSLSLSFRSMPYTFHASFPADYSKDIGGSFLLEANASAAVSASAVPSIALHTNDELQISIRTAQGARAGAGERGGVKGRRENYSRHAACKKRIYE